MVKHQYDLGSMKTQFIEHSALGGWWSYKPPSEDEGISAYYNDDCKCVIVCNSIYFKDEKRYRDCDPQFYPAGNIEYAWNVVESLFLDKYGKESVQYEDVDIIEKLGFNNKDCQDVLKTYHIADGWIIHYKNGYKDGDERKFSLVWILMHDGNTIRTFKKFEDGEILECFLGTDNLRNMFNEVYTDDVFARLVLSKENDKLSIIKNAQLKRIHALELALRIGEEKCSVEPDWFVETK